MRNFPVQLRRTRPCVIKCRFGRLRCHGPRNCDLLFVVDGVEQVVLEPVASVTAPSFPVVEDLRRLRQPHIQIMGSGMDRALLDRGAVSNQSNLWQGAHEIGLHPHYLKAVGCDPGAPFQRNSIDATLGPASLKCTDH